MHNAKKSINSPLPQKVIIARSSYLFYELKWGWEGITARERMSVGLFGHLRAIARAINVRATTNTVPR